MQAESIATHVLKEFDELAKAEYGTTLVQALETQPEDMFAFRLARLSGIPLKQPFSMVLPADQQSATKAIRYWVLRPDVQEEVARLDGPYPLLESMLERKDFACELIKEMTKVRFKTRRIAISQVADTINNAQHESNWFTNLILVIRPHLCKETKKNKTLMESIKKAADELAHKSVEKGLMLVVVPLTAKLVKSLPILHFVPHVTVIGVTYFIVKYASRTFCTAEIAPEFTMLLGGNYSYESK